MDKIDCKVDNSGSSLFNSIQKIRMVNCTLTIYDNSSKGERKKEREKGKSKTKDK